MKILIIGTSVVPMGLLRYGGIEKLSLDFVNGLLREGHEITVAAPIGSNLPKQVTFIPTVSVPNEQDRDDIALNKIGEYITQNVTADHKPTWDVIHDFSHLQLISRMGVPAIYHMWDPILYKMPTKSTYNQICLSNWQASRFEQVYNQKGLVMPLLVDTGYFKPLPNAERKRFLFLGKLTASKGAHLALEYCKEMGYPLDIVGGLIPSDPRDYVDYLKQELTGDMHLYFNVTEADKLKFLQNALALIYPVEQEEASWLVGHEAWSVGTTTITYDKGSMREVCPTGVVRSKEAFLKEMKHVWDGAVSPKDIRGYAEMTCSMEAALPRYIRLYDAVSKGARW